MPIGVLYTCIYTYTCCHIYITVGLWRLFFGNKVHSSIPNDKTLDLSKLKTFADDEIDDSKIIDICILEGQKTWEKGEHAGCQHFLFFPRRYFTSFYLRPVISRVGVISAPYNKIVLVGDLELRAW